MMDRRTFRTTVVAGIAAAPVMGDAQQAGKVWRIGVLVTGPPPDQHVCVLALRRGLADLGYVDGTTHILDTRWAYLFAGTATETPINMSLERLRVAGQSSFTNRPH